MADAKSDFLERKNLDHNLATTAYPKPNSVYAALFTSNPSDAANGAEVSGGGYARQVATFGAAATDASGNSTASNSAALQFTNLPTATLSHCAIYDASTNGNLLYYGPLAAPKSVTSGDTFTINAGQLTVQEQ
jgi:hypothetical protein